MLFKNAIKILNALIKHNNLTVVLLQAKVKGSFTTLKTDIKELEKMKLIESKKNNDFPFDWSINITNRGIRFLNSLEVKP